MAIRTLLSGLVRIWTQATGSIACSYPPHLQGHATSAAHTLLYHIMQAYFYRVFVLDLLILFPFILPITTCFGPRDPVHWIWGCFSPYQNLLSLQPCGSDVSFCTDRAHFTGRYIFSQGPATDVLKVHFNRWPQHKNLKPCLESSGSRAIHIFQQDSPDSAMY